MILISDLQNIQNHGLTLFALNNSWLPSSAMWELPLQYTTPSKLFEPNSKCFDTMTFHWLSKFLTGFHVQQWNQNFKRSSFGNQFLQFCRLSIGDVASYF